MTKFDYINGWLVDGILEHVTLHLKVQQAHGRRSICSLIKGDALATYHACFTGLHWPSYKLCSLKL
jgi:hypothetical protein